MENELLLINEEVYKRKHQDVTHLLTVLEQDELFANGIRNIQRGASKGNAEMIASFFGLFASGGSDIQNNLDVHVLISNYDMNGETATSTEIIDIRNGSTTSNNERPIVIAPYQDDDNANYSIYDNIQKTFVVDPYLSIHNLNTYIGAPIINEDNTITGAFALLIDKNLDDEIDFWGKRVLVKNVLPLLSIIMSSSIAQCNMKDKSNKLNVDALIAENIAYGLNAHAVETLQHCNSSANRALAIANAIGITSEADLSNLRTAAKIHDLGKHGVPTRVLKQTSKLTDAEFELMKNHTNVGERIARLSGLSEEVIRIIRCHHLRWDGKGYPDDTEGDDIPILAQIMKIADYIDARLEKRSYHNSIELDELVTSLQCGSGIEFSPKILNIIFSSNDEIYNQIFEDNKVHMEV
jgi:putative nucleotidyltransferase with HDIG domain